jgi:hypothetical protein
MRAGIKRPLTGLPQGLVNIHASPIDAVEAIAVAVTG